MRRFVDQRGTFVPYRIPVPQLRHETPIRAATCFAEDRQILSADQPPAARPSIRGLAGTPMNFCFERSHFVISQIESIHHSVHGIINQI